MKRLLLIVAILLSFCAHAQTTRPLIGTWYQPQSSFAKWKARGINTLIGYESEGGAVSIDQYLASAKAAGLGVFVQSTAVRPQDYINPIVAGVVNSPDEPDGVGGKTPGQMLDSYVAIKTAMANAKVDKPVLINFDGNKMPYRPNADYIGYCRAADVIAFDFYPFNFGQGSASIPKLAAFTKQLAQASGGKPVYAFIESSNQDLNKQPWTAGNDASGTPLGPKMRGPTVFEFTAEVQTAIASGVAGIFYFPDQIGLGWEGPDGTPNDVAAAMTTLNASFVIPAAASPASPAVTTKPSVPITITVPGYTPQTITLQPQ